MMRIVAVGLSALFVISGLARAASDAAPASTPPGIYKVAPAGWLCDSPGTPTWIDVQQGPQSSWPAAVQKNMRDQRCLSAAIAIEPIRINVIAFMGRIAFVCQKQDLSDGGRDQSFYCQYVMTKHLRTLDDKAVPNQVSKKSPSPTFFDDAVAWTIEPR